MEAKELFGVVVRTLGLVIVLYGSWNVVFGFGRLARAIASSRNPTRLYFFTGVFFIVVGVLLISGADSIVAASYHVAK